MNITKQDVVQSATKLFKERGFLYTSIQNIADDCKIAKGSVYKYFSSKEDLFSQVFDQCQNDYFHKVEELLRVSGLSKEDQFVQQIILRFQYFTEYKSILVEFTELPIQQDPVFSKLRHSVRGRLLEWHMECLKNLYGERINSYLWDLVSIYRALLKEYLFWIIYEDKTLSLDETAWFILDKLNVIVHHMSTSNAKPLLEQQSFENYIRWGVEGRKENSEQAFIEILGKIHMAIDDIHLGETYSLELKSLLKFLEAEVKNLQPNRPLIQATLFYLQRETTLKSLVVQLENIINSGI